MFIGLPTATSFELSPAPPVRASPQWTAYSLTKPVLSALEQVIVFRQAMHGDVAIPAFVESLSDSGEVLLSINLYIKFTVQSKDRNTEFSQGQAADRKSRSSASKA